MQCPHCKKEVFIPIKSRPCTYCGTGKVNIGNHRIACPNFCPHFINSTYYDAKGKFCCIKKLDGELLKGFLKVKRILDRE